VRWNGKPAPHKKAGDGDGPLKLDFQDGQWVVIVDSPEGPMLCNVGDYIVEDYENNFWVMSEEFLNRLQKQYAQ
jgi:hypothetical protein